LQWRNWSSRRKEFPSWIHGFTWLCSFGNDSWTDASRTDRFCTSQQHRRGSILCCSLFQTHGKVGFLLVAVFWPLNWALPGMRTAICSFHFGLGTFW
jgi:hypothetical protein